ncbi:diguanylate cyclase [Alkalinema sp. FACHB-956]|uniref:diguanylate cyclase domain-containing protein n=1 Tax=Alkalinema sp. FACHB-956 TaxID=2692768 RepID=UPI00168316FD|nr:diguanylate cyclase [Alkalinema sp. FACHB-956]MBD2328709.1 diguanylate cyclase [Alkalinema sp. FACHB-956]
MTPVRILVVDDELELERLIKQRFRKQITAKTMDFIFAANGIEALHRLQHDRQIDMVLTDLNMPEMDGFTLMQHLPKVNDTLKVVVISAYNDMARIRQAMNAGAFDFLTKPIDFHDLKQTIEKTIESVQRLRHQKIQAQQFQEALLEAAFHDTLTGLPNRRGLCHHLNHLFDQPKLPMEHTTAVLFIDLDGFKQVNDELGHLIGDELLKQVAQRLVPCLREGDLVARLGGDEFVIVLSSIVDGTVAIAVVERIQAQLKKPFELGGVQIVIGASIGITIGKLTDQPPEDLLREADLAMYSAKAQGKGCYVLFNAIQQP